MAEFDTRKMMAAAAAPAPAAAREPRTLSPAAQLAAAQPISNAWSPIVLAGFVRVAEFALTVVVGLALYFGYVVPANGFEWHYIVATFGIATLAMLAFQAADIYQVQAFRGYEKQYFRLASAWSVVFLLAIGATFFAKLGTEFSRVWLGGFYVAGLVALISFRRLVFVLVRRWTREGRLDRRTVVVGADERGDALISSLDAQRDSDVRVLGVFDDRSDERASPVIAGRPKLGTVDDLVEFARKTRIDLVIFSLPISAEGRILQMLKKLWVLPVDIRLSAHSNKLRFRPRAYSYIGNVPVLDVFDKPITDWDVVMKWLFDKIVGSLILIAASPVMLLTAIAIKLDSRGPVLFKQRRYGFNNELIEVYKFRSMYVDQCDATAAKLTTKDDPRVTRVGRFIRKTSIDELPQLFNVVFKGNLSLVGPRPHAIHAKAENRLYDEAVDGYFARHRVKPGITGWAQINGWRGETDTHEKIQRRVEHDLYYIENWSILFDLYILAKTPFALARHTEHAY
jgi:Undecaprenyl-phosphate glucose phosphotransferase